MAGNRFGLANRLRVGHHCARAERAFICPKQNILGACSAAIAVT
jgi:hypothetical protein